MQPSVRYTISVIPIAIMSLRWEMIQDNLGQPHRVRRVGVADLDFEIQRSIESRPTWTGGHNPLKPGALLVAAI